MADETETQNDAKTMILGGLGIGALGVVSAVIGGAVCPACVVAAPALLGLGVYKRWKQRGLDRERASRVARIRAR